MNINSPKSPIFKSPRFVIGSRIFFTIIGWLALIISFSRACTGEFGCWFIIRTYTIQTNFIALVWLTLALYWKDHAETAVIQKLKLIKGNLRTAITVYVTITWLVFMVLLQIYYTPTGMEFFTNIMLHYVTPMFFIFDWYNTNEVALEYKFSIFWLIYPITYLIFNTFMGSITGTYIYYFLDPTRGLIEWMIWISIITLLFLGIGSLCVKISRKQT
jgi:hypothetical protein